MRTERPVTPPVVSSNAVVLAAAVLSAAAVVCSAAAVVCSAVAWLVLVATPAQAHNVLLSTSPAAGATVPFVPGAVVLMFDEPALALGTAVAVTGPAGLASVGPVTLVDTTVREAIRIGSPAGSYTVRWRVTSADGHPVTGSFSFTAQRSGGSAPGATGTSPVPAPSLPWWVVPIGAAVVAVLVGAAGRAAARRRGQPRDG